MIEGDRARQKNRGPLAARASLNKGEGIRPAERLYRTAFSKP